MSSRFARSSSWSRRRDVERSKAVALWVENESRKIGLDLETEKMPAEGFGEHLVSGHFMVTKAENRYLLGHTDT